MFGLELLCLGRDSYVWAGTPNFGPTLGLQILGWDSYVWAGTPMFWLGLLYLG